MRLVLQTFLLAVVLFSTVLFAQTGKIAGVVKDSKTGETLMGVNIIVEGTRLGATSNMDGYYVILNVPPGSYSLKASMIGYSGLTTRDVKVNISQTTEINFSLVDQTIQTQEVVIVAETPVVQKDVGASTVNLDVKQFENMPVVNVSSVVGLQAGIVGGEIRGGDARETSWMLNGAVQKAARNGSPTLNVSMLSVDNVQIQRGGFDAQYGNVRSGVINVVTKEGSRSEYSFGFQGRLRPAGKKNFGNNPSDPNSFWMRPYMDDAVAWTGTGSWDLYTQRQYQSFIGWNKLAQDLLKSDPTHPLTPAAAQKLFLWQHRKDFRIQDPDYTYDMSLSGPVPIISKELGNLRFIASARGDKTMLMVPLATPDYNTYTINAKVTSDIAEGMKVSLEGYFQKDRGTALYNDGTPGIFSSTGNVASSMGGITNYGDARMFGENYWNPTDVKTTSIASKFTHAISSATFYDVLAQYYATDYNTSPARERDESLIYPIVDGYYYANEAPYGWEQATQVGIGSAMRMGVGMGNGRDTSRYKNFSLRFDLQSQLDKYNNLKTGFEFSYGDQFVSYGSYDLYLPSGNRWNHYNVFPLTAGIYASNKIEYEGMIVTAGLRFDYFSPNEQWYVLDNPYDPALSAPNASKTDQLLAKSSTKAITTLSPRLQCAFPITETSKLFFNYIHARQLPDPNNTFRLQRNPYAGNAVSVWPNPSLLPEKTITYEMGYEQSFFDEYLLHLTGYYKDVSNQPRSVTYITKDGTVNYTSLSNDNYHDVRGFEVELFKDRGSWFQGFANYTYSVETSGNFNYSKYNQNPALQREFIRTTNDQDQVKPIPAPYARMNLRFFTPSSDFGPEFAGIGLFTEWYLTVNASWSSGGHETWTGGSGTITGVQNNIQWLDNWGTSLRLSKNFKLGPANFEFFMDMDNVFNVKQISSAAGGGTYGFSDGNDYNFYLKSLHMPESWCRDNFGYINIPGEDKPGMYRAAGTDYTPMEGAPTLESIGSPNSKAIYWVRSTGKYMQNTANGWVEVDNSRVQKILDDKSYIDMPNLDYLSFIFPRNIFWGVRFTVNF